MVISRVLVCLTFAFPSVFAQSTFFATPTPAREVSRVDVRKERGTEASVLDRDIMYPADTQPGNTSPADIPDLLPRQSRSVEILDRGVRYPATAFAGQRVILFAVEPRLPEMAPEGIHRMVQMADFVYDRYVELLGVEPAGEGRLVILISPKACVEIQRRACAVVGRKEVQIQTAASGIVLSEVGKNVPPYLFLHEIAHCFDLYSNKLTPTEVPTHMWTGIIEHYAATWFRSGRMLSEVGTTPIPPARYLRYAEEQFGIVPGQPPALSWEQCTSGGRCGAVRVERDSPTPGDCLYSGFVLRFADLFGPRVMPRVFAAWRDMAIQRNPETVEEKTRFLLEGLAIGAQADIGCYVKAMAWPWPDDLAASVRDRYSTVPAPCLDVDQDGYSPVLGDSDDANAAIHPGATEVQNGVDDDGNGLVDETAVDLTASDTPSTDPLPLRARGEFRFRVHDGPASAEDILGISALMADASGDIYFTDTASSSLRVVSKGAVRTIAGGMGEAGFADGVATAARFNAPSGLARDREGNFYVADANNHVIRKVTPTGVVTTIAGQPGVDGCLDGPGNQALLGTPIGVAVNAAGEIFVADAGQNQLRRIGLDGRVDSLSDPCPDSETFDQNRRIHGISAVAVLPSQEVIVADGEQNLLLKWSADQGWSPYAGSGTFGDDMDGAAPDARFSSIFCLTALADGSLLVGERYTGAVRLVRNGEVSTPWSSLGARWVQGVATLPDGSIIVGDRVGRGIFSADRFKSVTLAGGSGVSISEGPETLMFRRSASEARSIVARSISDGIATGRLEFSGRGMTLVAPLAFPAYVLPTDAVGGFSAEATVTEAPVSGKFEIQFDTVPRWPVAWATIRCVREGARNIRLELTPSSELSPADTPDEVLFYLDAVGYAGRAAFSQGKAVLTLTLPNAFDDSPYHVIAYPRRDGVAVLSPTPVLTTTLTGDELECQVMWPKDAMQFGENGGAIEVEATVNRPGCVISWPQLPSWLHAYDTTGVGVARRIRLEANRVAPGSVGFVALGSGSASPLWIVQSASTLTLSPPSVTSCSSSRLGRVTLSWVPSVSTSVQLRVGSPDGPLMAASNGPDSATTGDWVKDRMLFFLVRFDGAPLAVTSASVACQ